MNKILRICDFTKNSYHKPTDTKKKPLQENLKRQNKAKMIIMPALLSSLQSTRCSIRDDRHGVRTEP